MWFVNAKGAPIGWCSVQPYNFARVLDKVNEFFAAEAPAAPHEIVSLSLALQVSPPVVTAEPAARCGAEDTLFTSRPLSVTTRNARRRELQARHSVVGIGMRRGR